uniref:C2H2-type domain-containing protein n=1 Tax=Scleropages formosus TaxID=113540 RepID=A0A8C9T0W6_SCLFO
MRYSGRMTSHIPVLFPPCLADCAPGTPQPVDLALAPAPPPPPLVPPSWPLLANGEAGKYCCLCGAWFNNPLMAQQHYEGKKHKRNAARARLLEQLAGSLGATETTAGLRSSYSCSMCNVILNSIEQYHAHLRGSKHQNNLKQHQK